MDEHSEHEVRRILEETRAAGDPIRYRATRRAAAQRVIDEFLATAETQGMASGTERDEQYLVLSDVRTLYVKAGHAGEILMRIKDGMGPDHAANVTVPLYFDCFAGTLFGEVDTSIAPTPGKPLPRVHAAVVLANTVANLLAGINVGEIAPYNRAW